MVTAEVYAVPHDLLKVIKWRGHDHRRVVEREINEEKGAI